MAARCRSCKPVSTRRSSPSGLGHANVRSTDPYIHADMTIKEKTLALVTPPDVKPGRYKPSDQLLAFLEGL
jgi:hypothetical protein